jgi:hypothetical protein
MPRKQTGPETWAEEGDKALAQRLADELRVTTEGGQPLIDEREFRTGKIRVNVIWDEWDGIPLPVRSATILQAYASAEGPEFRDRIALASGLTVPEAHAAGMLPYQILPALRSGDPVSEEDVHRAMLAEGASRLLEPETPRLWFPTKEEAEAGRRRLATRLPTSEAIWIINREIAVQDHSNFRDTVDVRAE